MKKFPEVPPWSGQVISRNLRALAWAPTVLLLVSPLGLAINIAMGRHIEPLPGGALALLLGLYTSLVLAHVAVKGKAPVTWLPWK